MNYLKYIKKYLPIDKYAEEYFYKKNNRLYAAREIF
jgi:hypothetical protein